MKPVISQDEIDNLLREINDKMDDEDYLNNITSNTRRIRIYDFLHPIFLDEENTIEFLKKFNAIAQYFQKDFYKMTGIDMDCTCAIERNATYECASSIEAFKKDLKNPNYIREYKLDDAQLFIQVDPVLIDKILLGRTENTDITPVTKRLANQYFFNVLKEILSNFSNTTITDVEQTPSTYTSYLQNVISDNIIENPKHIISNKNYDVSTYKMILKCSHNDIEGNITFEFDWEACLKFLGYKRHPYFYDNEEYYNNQNIYVIVGSANLRDKDIEKLKEGSSIKLDRFAGEPMPVVINNEVMALSEAVQIDYNFGVRITETKEENDDYFNNLLGNTFVVLGSATHTNEEIDNMGEGTIIRLDSQVGEYSLLVHNNKIIAMGDVEVVGDMFSFKIAKIIENPIYFKKSIEKQSQD